MSTPETSEQILQSNSGLIHRVVMHCNDPGSVPDLSQTLDQAEENGWDQLVAIIRNIMSGQREDAIPPELDGESRVVAEAILEGLHDPSTLPDMQTDLDSPMAGRGIAGLLHASRNGSGQAQRIITGVAKQMQEAGGDMDILAHRIQELLEGEQDMGRLTRDMGEKGQMMMFEIIGELSRLKEEQSSSSND
jgi:hypothetical protein